MSLFGVRTGVWLLPERLSSNEHVFRQQQKRQQHKKPQYLLPPHHQHPMVQRMKMVMC
jgi:hypothetical protein